MSEKKTGNGAYIAKLALTLLGITAVVALCLGVINMITAPRIAELAAETKKNSMYEVMNDASQAYTYEQATFDASVVTLSGADGGVSDAFVVKDASGTTIGYAVQSAANGFNGAVDMMIGIDVDGKVIGVSVLKQAETAGMGANCTKEDFRSQFVGVVNGFLCLGKAEKKDGDGNIQAMTGSTITSKTCTRAVNYALSMVENGGVK